MNPRPRGVRSITEHTTALAALPVKRTRCPDHGHLTPCGSCRADHLAGEHLEARLPTCPACPREDTP
ncbi:MAG: hypothetical protein FWF90_15690 [Promicromonosporaceae bacterium]|nr:hypothetical protein [Promicromonosporaceae bacterium]